MCFVDISERKMPKEYFENIMKDDKHCTGNSNKNLMIFFFKIFVTMNSTDGCKQYMDTQKRN